MTETRESFRNLTFKKKKSFEFARLFSRVRAHEREREGGGGGGEREFVCSRVLKSNTLVH